MLVLQFPSNAFEMSQNTYHISNNRCILTIGIVRIDNHFRDHQNCVFNNKVFVLYGPIQMLTLLSQNYFIR